MIKKIQALVFSFPSKTTASKMFQFKSTNFVNKQFIFVNFWKDVTTASFQKLTKLSPPLLLGIRINRTKIVSPEYLRSAIDRAVLHLTYLWAHHQYGSEMEGLTTKKRHLVRCFMTSFHSKTAIQLLSSKFINRPTGQRFLVLTLWHSFLRPISFNVFSPLHILLSFEKKVFEKYVRNSNYKNLISFS